MTTDDRSEQRAESRARTIKAGTISYKNESCTMECAILDLSAKGAKLKPRDAMLLPEVFRLRIPYGRTYDCEVVRRWRDQVGVRFL